MSTLSINSYPMGPTVRRWLGVHADLYTGNTANKAAEIDPELMHLFRRTVISRLTAPDISLELTKEELTDLIEELVAMDMPELALRVFDSYKEFVAADDFRLLLSLGNAAMTTDQLALAEHFFHSAQNAAPSEPAPYVNLTQLYLYDQRYEEAKTWSETGLKTAVNFRRLWWHYWQLLEATHTDQAAALISLEKAAHSHSSWAGFSLLAELESPGDAGRQILRLAPLLSAYASDTEYLIEYTGALGNAGMMQEIPGIIWSTERLLGISALPWQLNLHAAQAHLHLENRPLFNAYVQKIEGDATAPKELIEHLQELKKESAESRSDATPTASK